MACSTVFVTHGLVKLLTVAFINVFDAMHAHGETVYSKSVSETCFCGSHIHVALIYTKYSNVFDVFIGPYSCV